MELSNEPPDVSNVSSTYNTRRSEQSITMSNNYSSGTDTSSIVDENDKVTPPRIVAASQSGTSLRQRSSLRGRANLSLRNTPHRSDDRADPISPPLSTRSRSVSPIIGHQSEPQSSDTDLEPPPPPPPPQTANNKRGRACRGGRAGGRRTPVNNTNHRPRTPANNSRNVDGQVTAPVDRGNPAAGRGPRTRGGRRGPRTRGGRGNAAGAPIQEDAAPNPIAEDAAHPPS